MTTPAEVTAMIAEALEISSDDLSPETAIADVEEWNSIGWLTIMSLADERLNIQIGSRDIRGFKTVKDVTDYILNQVAAAS